jgi:hypothetical protein
MKKALLIFAVLFGFAAVSVAQPKALGVRFGYGVDLSYENYAGGSNFLEFELGLDNGYHGDAFHVDGVYNFMIAQPNWTNAGSWGFYGGPGASIAMSNGGDSNTLYAGIVGNLGLEYTFNIPLQLSLDVRPRLMFGNGGVWSDGIFTFGLGIRYAF